MMFSTAQIDEIQVTLRNFYLGSWFKLSLSVNGVQFLQWMLNSDGVQFIQFNINR